VEFCCVLSVVVQRLNLRLFGALFSVALFRFLLGVFRFLLCFFFFLFFFFDWLRLSLSFPPCCLFASSLLRFFLIHSHTMTFSRRLPSFLFLPPTFPDVNCFSLKLRVRPRGRPSHRQEAGRDFPESLRLVVSSVSFVWNSDAPL